MHFCDVAQKLLLLRIGTLFSLKHGYPDLENPKFDFLNLDEVRATKELVAKNGNDTRSIYADKPPDRINKKHVFRIWREWVSDVPKDFQSYISFDDLCRIFPEHKERLILWDNCCDRDGFQIRGKNLDIATEYFKRHNKKTLKQKNKAKYKIKKML